MTRSSAPTPNPLPTWFRRLGAGLTAMLAVLFVVLLAQLRQQARSLRSLGEKVEKLENARALERTSALEEQLRVTTSRMQDLEQLRSTVESLESDQAQLRQDVRRQAIRDPLLPEIPPLLPPAPQSRTPFLE